MVCLNVPRLGYVSKPCLARPMLFAALECYEAGDYIGAGVRLREAVNRFLASACEWYDCEVKSKHPRPTQMAWALHNAKQIDKWSLEVILEIIDTGNKLAHCQKVDGECVRSGIALMFTMMDGQPYCPTDRQPIATSYLSDGECDELDDDDDDDDWKIGGAV